MITALLSILLNVYFVSFCDKAGSQDVALSATAMSMRAVHGIEIDSLDYAVSPVYLDSLRGVGVRIHHTSRWMNGATIGVSDTSVLQRIRLWPFVRGVEQTRYDESWESRSVRRRVFRKRDMTFSDYGEAQRQLSAYNLQPLHDAGYHGQGIRIAVIDGGFEKANTLGALDSVRQQLLGCYDLTDDVDDFFGSTGSHGTMCLSTIAAVTSDYRGAATQSTYYMIRSEENVTESPKEMDNLVAAFELADSLGVHICSVSLGYYLFDDYVWDLSYADMDGKTTRVSRSATIAARKGMLVCLAAGNEGDSDWRYLTAPSDADSILSVGAVDVNGAIASFSSYGPSADGRIKPDVCAVGRNATTIRPSSNQVVFTNGTSFACPLLAGMAACLWSALPGCNNMEIRERIIRSANRYASPDERYGYGIPNAWAAYMGTTAVEDMYGQQESPAEKVLYDGHWYIVRGGEWYDMMGRKAVHP